MRITFLHEKYDMLSSWVLHSLAEASELALEQEKRRLKKTAKSATRIDKDTTESKVISLVSDLDVPGQEVSEVPHSRANAPNQLSVETSPRRYLSYQMQYCKFCMVISLIL